MLVANRGEIARRIALSCQQLGLTPVMVYTEPDALSLHVLEAEATVCLGASPQDYTSIAKLVDAAVSTGYTPSSRHSGHPGNSFEDVAFLQRSLQPAACLAPAVLHMELLHGGACPFTGTHVCRCVACHPGYGFLSENADFLSALEERGLAFLGPTADTMRMFSRKHTARQHAQEAGVPVLPGGSLARLPDRCCYKAHRPPAQQICGWRLGQTP